MLSHLHCQRQAYNHLLWIGIINSMGILRVSLKLVIGPMPSPLRIPNGVLTWRSGVDAGLIATKSGERYFITISSTREKNIWKEQCWNAGYRAVVLYILYLEKTLIVNFYQRLLCFETNKNLRRTKTSTSRQGVVMGYEQQVISNHFIAFVSICFQGIARVRNPLSFSTIL